MVEPAYRYRAALERVIDADTYVLRVDLGFRVSVALTIRVRDYDAPEITGNQRPYGLLAKDAAATLLSSAKTIVVETYKDEQSFARWIADVYIDGALIADKLRAAGHVK